MQLSFLYAIVAFAAAATAAPTAASVDELAARQLVPIPRRFLPAGGNKANWRTFGCAADLYPDARRLNGGLKELPGTMTIGQCLAFCDSRKQRYAGLEFGYQCFCGPQLDFGSGLTSPAATLGTNNGGCNTPAPGNTTQNAGGANHLLVFESLVNGPATQPAVVSGFNYVGCFPDQSANRLLPLNYYGLNANTIETCIARCKSTGNDLASLEFGTQCHCGKAAQVVLPATIDATKCEYACPGNDKQLCGGLLAQALYRDALVVVPPPGETPPTDPEITNPGPIATSRGDFNYVGCFAETLPIRVLAYGAGASQARTNAGCARTCANLDYRYSSTSGGNTCRCGNTAGVLTESTACNIPCTGIPTQICGGNLAQSVYAQEDAPVPNTEVAVNALA